MSVGKTLLKEGVVPKRLKTCYFTKPSLCKEYVTLKACCCESETLRLITFVTFYQDRISLNIFFLFFSDVEKAVTYSTSIMGFAFHYILNLYLTRINILENNITFNKILINNPSQNSP